ncbi:MAG: hypothetical protein SNJ57_15450 [Cyanobacteriota bacterium]
MSSIILSFVGQQDPVSDITREEGSIVSLIHHLMTLKQPIKQVILLYTEGPNGTQERAELTQEWLAAEPFSLPKEAIALLPVGEALSQDPVNLLLAVQAARQGLEQAIAQVAPSDTLEFNASSGTPVMKSAWNLLQAAGYAPKSRVWQVRNPKEQQQHQARVFQTNLQVLRQEFDIQVIRQQLKDYNYAGALTTLRAAGLTSPLLEGLLTYGHCRLSLDFRRAQAAIAPLSDPITQHWQTEITALVQHNPVALLREAYFNAIVEIKNQKFSDGLVRVSQFQEKALNYFVTQQLQHRPPLPKTFEDTRGFWSALENQHPTLYAWLQAYRFRDKPLTLDKFPSRPTLIAILEFAPPSALPLLQSLNAYCEQRNSYIHNFEGISELEGVEDILRTMRQVLEHLHETDFTNPFNRLNQEIERSLQLAIAPA